MESLACVRELELPDWAIGAGFVRNAVWDHLHGFVKHTALEDVDVLYFNSDDTEPGSEIPIEECLLEKLPNRNWSVKNQARMHLRNGDEPYASTSHAMEYWLETATCVAARLEDNDAMSIIAPFGLSDLLSLKSRPTAAGLRRHDQYIARMQMKSWSAHWPEVAVKDF